MELQQITVPCRIIEIIINITLILKDCVLSTVQMGRLIHRCMWGSYPSRRRRGLRRLVRIVRRHRLSRAGIPVAFANSRRGRKIHRLAIYVVDPILRGSTAHLIDEIDWMTDRRQQPIRGEARCHCRFQYLTGVLYLPNASTFQAMPPAAICTSPRP